MFQAVMNQAGGSTARFGTGMWVSLAVHLGLFGGLVGLSGRGAALPEKAIEIGVFKHVPPQPPKGSPTPKLATQPPPKPKPRHELRQPRKIPPPPQEPVAQTPPEPEPAQEELPSVPGGDPHGVETGGVVGATALAVPIDITPPAGGTGEEVMPFGMGMTPPQLVSEGTSLRYTSEAMQARVSGLLIARCTISSEGDVKECHVIKGLPFMDEAVLESLTSRHYRPVTWQGRAVSVKYTFNVRLKLP
jgi:protein TonB